MAHKDEKDVQNKNIDNSCLRSITLSSKILHKIRYYKQTIRLNQPNGHYLRNTMVQINLQTFPTHFIC